MKVIIPVDETKKEICPVFGRAPYFALYNEEDDELRYMVNTAAEEESGAGISAAQIVVDEEADVLLTPRLGENSAELLKAAEMTIFKTEGSCVEENIQLWKKGVLKPLVKFHGGYHGIR